MSNVCLLAVLYGRKGKPLTQLEDPGYDGMIWYACVFVYIIYIYKCSDVFSCLVLTGGPSHANADGSAERRSGTWESGAEWGIKLPPGIMNLRY